MTHAADERFTFVDAPQVVTFRAVDPSDTTDLALVHRWMHEPHVERFWSMAWSLDDIAAYLLAQHDDAHVEPWLVEADSEPLAYVEIYRADEDPLAEVVATRPGDRGWHILVGPPDAIGSGVPRLIGRAVLRRCFADPATDRVLCEPDVRNTRMVAFCHGLGHVELAEVDHDDKRAAVLACTLDAFASRFPDDLARDAVGRGRSALTALIAPTGSGR